MGALYVSMCFCLLHPQCDEVIVAVQEFEKAGDLRDREVELKSKIDAIVNDKKAKDDAESDAAGDGGPMVNDTDIANIVAQWTGTLHSMAWTSLTTSDLQQRHVVRLH